MFLAFIAPLSYSFQKVWERCTRFYAQRRWIMVEVDSMRSPALFHAVANRIEEVAEKQSATCSSDVEALTEYDKTLGRTMVRMRYWGSRSRSMFVRLPGELAMEVLYDRGDDVICGRERSVQNRERLVLRLPASSNRLADKAALKDWLLLCMECHLEPQLT